jgi:hypothetical protein
MKRTSIDFSEHELLTTKTEHLTTYHLKKPGTVVQNIKFINTNGLLIVTGDYGNWVFCREFHPSTDSYASDAYWVEKLKHSSTQDPYIFSSETAEKQIQEIEKNHELSEEEQTWLDKLKYSASQGEYSYIAEAVNYPGSFPSEIIPKGKILTSWLLIIFDAYDEICSRLKIKTGKQRYTIAVDFDGTMVEHSYPKIGQDIGAWDWLKKFQEEGANLILHTVRSSELPPAQGRWLPKSMTVACTQHRPASGVL